MGYYIDLKSISIDKYKEILKTAELIPSWKILERDIDKNFDVIKKCNIKNLDELLIAFKDKGKVQGFSKQSGLQEDYLAVLKRVVNGYRQKPNRIKDFTCVTEDTVVKLEKVGIKNTLKLYDMILTDEKREVISNKTGISKDEIMKLAKLTDLSRIRWVNHTFAYVLLETGYDTAEKVANADYQELYKAVKQLNEEREIYNAHIGVRDMKMVVEAAKDLKFEIEY
ncbi:MAG: DUF4332 domain-containing protein [Ignavibacteria bacterium]|jgi:hypothetical protein